MKRTLLTALFVLIGLYVIYQGIITLTTTARGESIYVMHMLIPATDVSLYTFGSIFVVLGILFCVFPTLISKYIKSR